MRTTDGDVRVVSVRDRSSRKERRSKPWRQGLRAREWTRITGKETERDCLFIVWREGDERNLLFMVPANAIPYLWGRDLPELNDLYLDLEHEDGMQDDLTRLLGLVCVAVGATSQVGKLSYRGVAWPLRALNSMWVKYLVSTDQVDDARVGLVLCTGTKAPPEVGEGDASLDPG